MSAEAYGAWNVKKAFTPKVIAKSEEAKQRLKAVLLRSFLFQGMDDKDFKMVIDAMEERWGSKRRNGLGLFS